MSDRAVLRVTGLTVSYFRRRQRLPVISDLSFEIARGEAYALVGESGCGKTTAAMAVLQHLAPNAVVEAGSIAFEGKELVGIGERELLSLRGDRIAMVSQNPGSALNPSMPVGKQIAEVYRFHRGLDKPSALAEAERMLEAVRMPHAAALARRYPHQLSGGQQQRVMIAMALATDPALLVLDEPTTGLDATVEAEVLDLVANLRSEVDAAILFISHNLGIVARLCDRIGVLYAGELVEEGTVQATLASPRHPYTQGLLRSIPRAGVDKDAQRLIPIVGTLPRLGATVQGCAYAARCPIARDVCREGPIPLIPVADRLTRCLFPDEVASIATVADASAGQRARPHNPTPLLTVESVSKTYSSGRKQVVAVDDVSLEVFRGEFFGLVGESGSGKTSLARCIAGLSEVSSGRLALDGVEIRRNPSRRSIDHRRQIQMVFQNPDGALNPRLSIRRMIARSIRRLAVGLGSANRAARLTEITEAVHLDAHYLDVTPEALSGGLKQRVAIARSLAGEPTLVVCDEPTSALDVSIQAAILNLLVDIRNRTDVSYFFISHDLATIRYLADRVAVMYLGQIVETGTGHEVFSVPFHPYTEALLSAMPTVRADTRGPRITLTGALPDPANPPSGCRFHTRCPRSLGDLCRTVAPPWQETGHSLRYRCHIPPDQLATLQIQVQLVEPLESEA
jgi:peptide/nickel transport system ATP-binding protein